MSLSKSSTLKEVLSNPQGKAILQKYASKWLKNPLIKLALNFTLEEIAEKAPDKAEARELLEQIHEELQNI